jgi:hypothetical protein
MADLVGRRVVARLQHFLEKAGLHFQSPINQFVKAGLEVLNELRDLEMEIDNRIYEEAERSYD